MACCGRGRGHDAAAGRSRRRARRAQIQPHLDHLGCARPAGQGQHSAQPPGGRHSSTASVTQLTPGASTSALCEPLSFDIHCSEQVFATYLRDMQAVTIKISDAVKHTLVGAVTVPVEDATLRTLSLDALPILSPDNQRCLGKLGLTVTATFMDDASAHAHPEMTQDGPSGRGSAQTLRCASDRSEVRMDDLLEGLEAERHESDAGRSCSTVDFFAVLLGAFERCAGCHCRHDCDCGLHLHHGSVNNAE